MDESINNPFKIGGWYGMAEDGFSWDNAEGCGFNIPDKEASEVAYREKLRRMEKGDE